MTSVANDKANVMLGGEPQCLGHMDGLGDIDCILDEVTKGTWLGDGVVRVACSISKVRSHKRRRGLIAGEWISELNSPPNIHDFKNLLLLRQKPTLLQDGTFFLIV